MKNGFKRLKGAATASIMGIGALAAGGGSARSVSTVNIPTTVSQRLAVTLSSHNASARYLGIGGNSGNDSSRGIFEIAELSISTLTYDYGSAPTPSGLSHFITTGFHFITTTITTFGMPMGHSIPMGHSTPNMTPTTVTNYNTAYSNAFDGALAMTVDGTAFVNPDNTVDLTAGVVTSDTVVDIVPGIDAQIQYAFDSRQGGTSLGLVRALYTLTNTTDAGICTTVNISGNLGSDDSTTIQATHSGDLVADDTDMWTVSSATVEDPIFGESPPVLAITRYGTGAGVVPTQTAVLGSTDDMDNFANDYALGIPAGDTQRIMVFIEAHTSNAGAIAGSAKFESPAPVETNTPVAVDTKFLSLETRGFYVNTAPNVLAGITDAELATIVNYAAPPSVSCTSSSNDDDGVLGIGAFSLPGLATLMGLFGLLRLGRKKN